MTTKLETKKLKGPDAFQSAMYDLLAWFKGHKSLVALAFIPILLIVIGTIGWNIFAQQSKGKRLTQLAAIETKYSDEEAAADKQRDALRKQLEALPKPPAAKDKADPAKDPKREELEKQVRAIKADHQGSLVAYREFYGKNQANAEGWMAGMKASSILLDDGKLAEAKDILAPIVQKSVGVKFYQTQGRVVLINVLEDLGEFDAGIKEADTLFSLAEDQIKPAALLVKGRLLLNKNQKEEAKAVLDQIIEKHAAAPEADKARGLKALLF